MKHSTIWVFIICAVVALGCGANLLPFDGDAGTGTDTDTDTDVDTDTDTDTDTECVPESYQQCGTDGNVHWFDSCDVEGALVEDCSADHFQCVNLTSDTAECGCAENWSGALCDVYTVFVNVFAAASPDGLSWDSAFTSVQEGIDLANNACNVASLATVCQVWVSQGTYFIYLTAPEDTVVLMPEVDVYGGFSAVETALDQRDWVANVTILDGHNSTSTAQVYHVVTGSNDAIIDGFTITGGNADGTTSLNDRGGGMLNSFSSPTVVNCAFENNYAVTYGGAVFNTTNAAVFVNCNFTSNTTPNWGGGIFNSASTTTLTSCVFMGNTAGLRGGGMLNMNTSLPELANITFYNGSSEYGGAMFNVAGSSPVITNCILWGNTATTSGNEMYNQPGADPVVTYSNIEGGYTGTGNIDSDPLFADAGAGDLHLSAGSPCIDAANGSVAPEFDLDGNPREDDLTVPNTGAGTPTYTDIGAYEYQP